MDSKVATLGQVNAVSFVLEVNLKHTVVLQDQQGVR